MAAIHMCAFAGAAMAAGSAFAQVGVDGVIGPEWSGAITHSVGFDPSAPTYGNFGAPVNVNHNVAYDTYMRFDGSFLYFAVAANPANGGAVNGFVWANIYLSTNPAVGSNIGLEVTNNNFFVPGVPGGYNAAGITTWATNGTTGVVEVAIPLSFFTTDPLGMGFSTADPNSGVVQWRLSQSLGYTVAGGPSYGNDRLGLVTLPTPGAAAIAGLGGLCGLRRRRR
jgi:hypothetical protein